MTKKTGSGGNDRKLAIEQYTRLMSVLADSPEGTVYHYTSAKGLRGIIENSELWLTNTQFVNDTTECNSLWSREALFKGGDFSNEFVKEMWTNGVRRSHRSDGTIYIASFSKELDSLAQWRDYGGFAVGFDATRLTRAGFFLCDCCYDDAQVKKWILAKEQLTEWKADCLNDTMKRAAAHSLLFFAQVKCKNVNYSSEREVRLVAISNHTWFYPNSPTMYENDPPVHFRDHPTYQTPVPFVKFFIRDGESQRPDQHETPENALQMKMRKLKDEQSCVRHRLPICEVRIGPMIHQEKARTACEILLKEKGYEDARITASDIPYRGF